MNGQIWCKSQMRQHLHLEMNGVIQKVNGGNNLKTDGVLLTSLNIRRFDFFINFEHSSYSKQNL
jgi:hypothetical protein